MTTNELSATKSVAPRPRRRRLLKSLVVTAGALTLLRCAQFASVSESMFLMSPDDEKALGQKLKPEVAKENKLDTNAQLNAYVRDLGNKLWLASPKGDVPPEFYVIDDENINAFAIPGGAVYMQTGTVRAAADEAELAGVLAHELGHVTRRHGARSVSHQSGVQALQDIILGKDAGQATQAIAGVVSQATLMRYTRDEETEADTIAVGTLDRAGYDPLALKTFFETLQKRYGDQSGRVAQLFASHPPTPERMNNVVALAAQLPNPPKARPTEALKRAQALLPPPPPAPTPKS